MHQRTWSDYSYPEKVTYTHAKGSKELLCTSHIFSHIVTPPSKLLWCHTNHCFTHPTLPSPPHHLYLSPPLSNCLHTVQGAHGLDGKPGPVVSGTRPVPLPCLLSSPFFSLYLSASTACLQLAGCLSIYVSVRLHLLLCLCLSFIFSMLPIG